MGVWDGRKIAQTCRKAPDPVRSPDDAAKARRVRESIRNRSARRQGPALDRGGLLRETSDARYLLPAIRLGKWGEERE